MESLAYIRYQGLSDDIINVWLIIQTNLHLHEIYRVRKGTAQRPLQHSPRSLCYSPHHSFDDDGVLHRSKGNSKLPTTRPLLGVGGTIYNTHTLKSFKELGLDSQELRSLPPSSKLHVHSVNFAAKLNHTRRALSSTVINSHQEPVSGQACNPPDPH